MNRVKLKHLLVAGAFLLALTTPWIAGSANAFNTTEETTTVVPANGYVRQESRIYRTYDEPDSYVIHREYERPRVYREYHNAPSYIENDGTYVYREHYETHPGVDIHVPFFRFRFGY
jgi:hypothetical protein